MEQHRVIPNTNEIGGFLHCGLCLTECPNGTSPREYARLEVGYTKLGMQIWCVRHDCNVIHLDFDGRKLRANTTRKLDS